MANSKPNAIVPYHDPTDEDQPSAEQLLNFGNDGAPSLGYDRVLGFDQNAQVPRPISSNDVHKSGKAIVSTCSLVPISTPIFGRSGDSIPGPFHNFASSGRSGQSSCNFMPVPGYNNVANWSNPGPSSSNVGSPPGLNSNVNSGSNDNSGNTLFTQSVPNVSDGGVPFGLNDPKWDPNFWSFLDDSTVVHLGGQFPGGPSSENTGSGGADGGVDFGNPFSIPMLPILPSPNSCSGCHTLREIIHTNGVTITNLEIHGRLGMNITHAILDTYDFSFSTENHTYQMFDFSNESINNIKGFLLQYCASRRLEGYSLVEDPLTIFYQTLFVGMDDDHMQNQNSFPQPIATDTGNGMMQQEETIPGQLNPTTNPPRDDVNDKSQQNPTSNVAGNTVNNRPHNPRQEGDSSRGRCGKTPLAIQRERTKKMKMKDFAHCLHLTIEEAAKEMKVCPTVIKKKCRAAGLDRWPHRKIKCYKRLISIKKEQLPSAKTDEEKKSIEVEIKMYEEELAKLYQLYVGEYQHSRN